MATVRGIVQPSDFRLIHKLLTYWRSLLAEPLPTLYGAYIARGYPSLGTSEKGAMALEEEVLTGLVLYWWVVFVLWATRRSWK
jgi:hypothetical protein